MHVSFIIHQSNIQLDLLQPGVIMVFMSFYGKECEKLYIFI